MQFLITCFKIQITAIFSQRSFCNANSRQKFNNTHVRVSLIDKIETAV